MPAVVSHRVAADPKETLPPGALEAEFAYHMAQKIRSGAGDDTSHSPHFGADQDSRVIVPGQSHKNRKHDQRHQLRKRFARKGG